MKRIALLLACVFGWIGVAKPCTVPMFTVFRDTQRAVALGRILDVRVEVSRKASRLDGLCAESASAEFRVKATGVLDFTRLGFQLKIVTGSVPFEVPANAVRLARDGTAIQSWSEDPSRIRPAFHARLAARLIASDGAAGPWRELDVQDPQRPPVVYVHPYLVQVLHFVEAGAGDKL